MNNIYLSLLLLATGLLGGQVVSAQNCNAATATQFVDCAANTLMTAITLNFNGNGTLTIEDDVDLRGIAVDLTNDNIIFNGEVMIDATTTFSGNGSAFITVNGITFSGSGGGSLTLADLNDAINMCGCTTLEEAANFAVMPVALISFTGKAEHRSVVLNWATATESDNDYFRIDHSVDGREFTTIGTVTGKGNSDTEVQYVYRHAPSGQGRHYYRLWQHDLDGTVTELGLVSVRLANGSDVLAVYPNPVGKSGTLFLSGTFDPATTTAYLVSPAGGQWSLTATEDGRVTLPTGLAAGYYYLRLIDSAGERALPVSIVE